MDKATKTATAKRSAKAKAQAKPKPAAKAKAPAPTLIGGAASQVQHLASDALEIALAERQGEQGRNAARFRRGELMVILSDEAKAMQVKQKDLLEDVNAYALELAERNGVLDYTPISSQEASTTRRVVERFGSSGDFPLVDAINKLTGDPLVGDDGEPLRIDLTSVALNKLYAVASIGDEYLDEAVSFAFRHSEKVVRKAKKVAKDTNQPLESVIRAVNSARVKAPHPVTGEPIEVQPEDRDAIAVLNEMAGEPAESEVVSIKTTRALYDGFYVPLKKLMSAVAKRYNPSLVATSSDDMVSNAFVLEQTIVQFFNVFEDEGVQRALAAMVASELITGGQADEFVDTFAFDPVTSDWTQVADVAAVASVVDEDGDVWDDIGDDDAQWDDGFDDEDDDEGWE